MFNCIEVPSGTIRNIKPIQDIKNIQEYQDIKIFKNGNNKETIIWEQIVWAASTEGVITL